jgi:hypothetical protein
MDEGTCSMEIQHGHQVSNSRTCIKDMTGSMDMARSKDIQHEHAARTYSMDIQQGQVAGTSRSDMQHEHAAWTSCIHAAWTSCMDGGTCSMEIQRGHPGFQFKEMQHELASRT